MVGRGERRSGIFPKVQGQRGQSVGDVALDDITSQPSSFDHHWNMGCVSVS